MAAILHLGNVEFQMTGDSGHNCVVKNERQLHITAKLLGVDPEGLADALTKRLLETSRGGAVTRINATLTVQQANGTRDALAKTLYSRLFNFLVGQTNEAMGHSEQGMSIGILDIYGFEVFNKNGFEQFCINYVNAVSYTHLTLPTICSV